MPSFEYKAIDPSGNFVKGTVEMDNLAAAAESLSSRGFRVEQLGVAPPKPEAPARPTKDITGERSPVMTHVVGPLIKVPLSQVSFFFRQLSTMMAAAVPPVQTLDTLAGQSQDPRLKHVIRELSQHVREGRGISAGMQRYPEVFSPLMLGMIRAGEEGGFVDRAAGLVAGYLEQEIKLRSLVSRLTFYPKLVTAASIAIVLGANFIIKYMTGKPGTLWSPLTDGPTVFVLLLAIAGFFMFSRVGLMNSRVKHNWDLMLLWVPYLGKTVKILAMAKFGRAFAALYKGGVPIAKSIQLSADACGSEYLRSKMYTAVKRVESGWSITDAMVETGAFNNIVLDMTRTGETTGNLDEMLDRLSEFYEDDAATRSTMMANMFGVFVLLLTGVYVGYVVISFWAGYGQGYSEMLQDT